MHLRIINSITPNHRFSRPENHIVSHRLHRHLTPISKRSDRTDRLPAVWLWNIKNQYSL